MSLWRITPRDPLVFGDGRSYSSAPGERAQSLNFPFSSTIAGAVRSMTGTDVNTGLFDKSRIDELMQISVHGPVLAEVDVASQKLDWLFPAPADALIVESGKMAERFFLAPGSLPSGTKTDIEGLDLIVPGRAVKYKVAGDAPRFWRWEQFQRWLEHPQDGSVDFAELGIGGPEREYRTHVRINPQTQAAEEGMLFDTSGMEFLRAEHDEYGHVKSVHSLVMAAETDAVFCPGLGHLGGERRIVLWEKSQDKLPLCPSAISQAIVKQKSCRLVLTTPAIFTQGSKPTYLQTAFGVKINLQAFACGRYQTISGWDYKRLTPKPTRRLAPAGSVYFLKLEGSDAEIGKFVNDVWLKPISDEPQDRLDGFGLALLGIWDGKLREVTL